LGRSSFEVVASKPLFHSWILLFGVLPIDRSDLTLLEVEQWRFIEQSPMVNMRLWRHEQVIIPTGEGALVTDKLEFSPRFAASLVELFVRHIFRHRHSFCPAARFFSQRDSEACLT
jgi:hypothetical protein